MKRLATAALVLVMIATLCAVPGEAGGRGGWHGGGGHGWHGGHGCCWGGWWWPGAFVGGLALGAAVAATYPPYYAYPPPAYYSAPSVVYAPAQTYTTAPSAPPAVQREVVYPHGKYVLYGDGVNQPWQWVWVSATPAPPAPSP
jgi:hypothetical protein